LFTDAGQAAQTFTKLTSGAVHADGGAGMAFQAGRTTLLRAFVAYGDRARFDVKLAQSF
jgi:hypothetical protein